LNGTQTAPTTGLTGGTPAFTMPDTSGTYQLRFFLNNSLTVLATSATITVAAVGSPTVTPSATTGTVGAPFTATVANGPGHPMDWVGLFATGAPSGNSLQWQYLNGTQTAPATGLTGGTPTFTMPTTPGTYQLRFFLNNTLTVLATSATITVAAVVAPTVTPSVTTGTAGTPFTATVANGPGHPMDWVGLFATGAPSANSLQWQYLNGTQTAPATGLTGGTLTLRLPLTQGTYELRFFLNNSLTVLATSATLTVQ
jgi:Ca-activated chloride channel family protein